MKQYLFIVLLIGVCFGQKNPCNDSRYIKLLNELVAKKNWSWSVSDRKYFSKKNSECLAFKKNKTNKTSATKNHDFKTRKSVKRYIGDDYYGILGYRNYKLDKECNTCHILPYYNSGDLTSVSPELTSVNPYEYAIILGLGYKKYNSLESFQTFSKYFVNYEFDGMDFNYKSKYGNNFDDYWKWGHFTIGAGYGIILKDGITLSTNIEYNLATSVDAYIENEYLDLDIPDYNYLSFKISIGVSKINQGIWKTPLGLHYAKPIGKYFINPNFSQIRSNEFQIEMPATWFAGGMLLYGLAYAMAEADSPTSSSSSSSSSNGKGCHIYGKIKFVEFGEDYKVKFVSFGEDLKVKYVSILADSPGEWQVVEFGEDYKIKVVEFGEDYKVKEVSFGEGCE